MIADDGPVLWVMSKDARPRSFGASLSVMFLVDEIVINGPLSDSYSLSIDYGDPGLVDIILSKVEAYVGAS